ncbi:MAG: urate hydroxylase PuuD [Akkermansiaceae bacterium]|jgi:uncharacterized membrane protein|nr:urate hydroxylase PuuD [Akkermansiaceae bacterium]
METVWIEWINVLFRFAHVVAGIMWIGNSLLFTWMELNLTKPEKDRDPDLLGELDMLHGGGVFHLEKRILHGNAIPERLHWFKWQSYTTWLTGFVLLGALFLSNGATLLDATKTHLEPLQGAGLSLLGIFGGWLVYDLIWRSPLGKSRSAGLIVSLLLLAGACFAYGSVFNGRALFLQIGAMMGTCMSANVFFHIISNQHKFMRSLRAGQAHDLSLGKRAKSRSLHNHYMTFPVVFLMLSAHFPGLYAADWKVPILLVVILALMAVKHLMNMRYHFKGWLASIFGVLALAATLIAVFLNQTAVADTTGDPAVAAGQKVFNAMACGACHMQAAGQIAPALDGVYGSMQVLADGSTVLADDDYLRRSILEPQAQVVKGYAPSMPSFAGRLGEREMDDLLAYLRSLRGAPGGK